MNDTLTAVPGIRVGHATDLVAGTGCTVVLCPPNTVGSVDVRGGAPGTRETDLFRPENTVQHVNAIFLAGGSAFGLSAADGIMRYLAEHEVGFRVGGGHVVPIVSGAILFDLMLGKGDTYPDAAMGYTACQAASDEPVAQGTIGAGTGASCGKIMGAPLSTKTGIGSASTELSNGLIVSALVAVNPVGDVVGKDGKIIAGLRDAESGYFVGTLNAFNAMANMPDTGRENTVIGVVATNAILDKSQAYKVSQMAHDGIARAVHPSHTPYDGDTIFTLATGSLKSDVGLVGALAAEVFTDAIRNAVMSATSLHGVRAAIE
ncbi:MAG: P1 family peptidase [Anaerolineae bacterium]|nr:P1 family peptidase [Anaerolineae bacterium]